LLRQVRIRACVQTRDRPEKSDVFDDLAPFMVTQLADALLPVSTYVYAWQNQPWMVRTVLASLGAPSPDFG